MTLAIELRVGALDAIAAHYGVGMDSVRRAARRGRVRLTEDRAFDRLRSLALAELVRPRKLGDAVRFHPEVNRTGRQGAA